jgi:IS30 family transposase
MQSPNKKVSYSHLTEEQRVQLAGFLRAKIKKKEIARLLGKDPSTIRRELRRNKTNNKTGYDARVARRKTKARRVKANKRFRKIENNPRLRKYVLKKIKKYWSPEQVAGRLKRERKKSAICHETIYQYIYTKKSKLKRYLRCQKGKYRRRYGSKKAEIAREEAKKKRIDVRPPIVDQRQRIGDWEGDTIRGAERTTAILTHVERKSGYLIADKLDKATAECTKNIITKRFMNIPKSKRYTITYDNGNEFSFHDMIEEKMKTDIYFAYPYHSWERGTNENTNGLLRQFFPKKTPFRNVTQKEINKKVWLINTRPRKRLSYLTPHEMFRKACTLD